MKKILSTVIAVTISACGFAQNSAIFKAQTLIDKGDYQGALTVLESAMTNEKTTKLAQVYNLAAKAESQVFNPELLKASQNAPFDTALFCSSLDKMITYFTKSHEEDVKPNEKGKVKSAFVEENNHAMVQMVDYYNYAAMFLYNNQQLDASCQYFKKYLDFPNNIVFTPSQSDSIRAVKKDDYAQTAFNITMIKYQEKKWDEVLETCDYAIKDPKYNHDLYIMKLEAYLEKGDTAAWVNTLKEAISTVENNTTYLEALISHYYQNNDIKGAEEMVQQLIDMDPDSKSAWYMKGCVDLNLKRDYPAAREALEKALAKDPNFVEANANIAYAYMNEINQRKNNGEFKLDRTKKAQFDKEYAVIKEYYEKARPYMEKVRELAPERSKMWAPALQMIYTNLQMKEEADQMDAIMEANNKAAQ